jgi:uncharacterized repeat protein (TIGR02543 family)
MGRVKGVSMKKLFLALCNILLVITFYSCTDLGTDEENSIPLGDNRFNGNFTYIYDYKAPDGINERYEKIELKFDGTNKAYWYHNHRSYYSGELGGWKTYKNEWNVKFEISDNMYRLRGWYSDEEFTEWKPYSFSDDGYTLYLNQFSYNIYKTDLTLDHSNKPPPPPQTYTVTFHDSFGNQLGKIENIAYDSTIAKPDDPEKDGYVFNGWRYPDGNLDNWDFLKYTVTNDIKLYANWLYVSEISNIVQYSTYLSWDNPIDNVFARVEIYSETDRVVIWTADNWITSSNILYFTGTSNYIKLVCVSEHGYKSLGIIYYWQ